MIREVLSRPVPWPRMLSGRRMMTGVAVVLIAHAGYLSILHWVVHAKLNAIRQQGFPVTLAELDQWYAYPPAEQNAAFILTNAFSHYVTWTNVPVGICCPGEIPAFRPLPEIAQKYPATIENLELSLLMPPYHESSVTKNRLLPVLGYVDLPPRGQPLPPDMKLLIGEYIRENQKALAGIHAAAKKDRFRCPTDLSVGPDLPLPHLDRLRHAARLLYLEALWRAEGGETQAAVDCVLDTLALGRLLGEEPLIVSQLVRINCDHIALANLERIINRTTLTPAQLLRIADSLQNSGNPMWLSRGLAGNRCQSIANLTTVYGETQQDPLFGLFWKWSSLRDQKLRRYLDAAEGFFEATHQHFPTRLAMAEGLSRKLEKLRSTWYDPGWLLAGGVAGSFENDASGLAHLRVALVATAVERYRLANGKLPQRLAELVPTCLPTVPADPFDGQPLRYRLLAKGYVVYSVNEDGNDDGGCERLESKAGRCGTPVVAGQSDDGDVVINYTYDITFTVER
ncbi:MAG: hypothetical protein HY646_20450 [Acidobacteria bacterium]|nr:hypothetical protein [Acidobacteriota bacterium]